VVRSEDGEEYMMRLHPTDLASVEGLFNHFEQIGEGLNNNGLREGMLEFASRVVSDRCIVLRVTNTIGDVGVVLVNDLVPGISATFNYLFWDRKTSGRHRVILAGMKWFAREFRVRRFELRCHALATFALARLYHLGAFYEGRKRKAWWYQDKMVDLYIFSILASELTEENSIKRSSKEKAWFAKFNRRGGK
jgi:hypothetical protein